MTTDTAERTEPQTATETQPTGDTEALRGTDAGAEAQTETGSEQQQSETTPSTREKHLSALQEAEREEERQRGRDEALAEIQQGTSKAQREAARQRLKEAFPTTIQSVESILNRVIDENRPLTTEEARQVGNHFRTYNLSAWDAASQEVSDTVRDAVYGLLSKDAQEAFTKDTSGNKDLVPYLTAAIERAAPTTKWAKSLSLEDAEKASPKLRKELITRDLTNHDAGYEEGLNAPPGTSPDGGRSANRTAPGNKTFEQLEDGYGRGDLNAADTKLYLQMRADKARGR